MNFEDCGLDRGMNIALIQYWDENGFHPKSQECSG